MKISLIQGDIAWNSPAQSLSQFASLAEAALRDGGEFLVFPEMFPCGFSMPEGEQARAFGEAGAGFLRNLASERRIHCVGTVPEVSSDGKLFNTALLCRPDGSSSSYRKMHLFSFGDETRRYSGGTGLLSESVLGVQCSFFICYDLRFPLPFFSLAQKTDLFVVMANWPASRREHWLTLLRARAIESQCYVAGVNRVGEGGGLAYCGDSSLFAPDGSQLLALGNLPTTATAEVASAAVTAWRDSFPALRDRQVQHYPKL